MPQAPFVDHAPHRLRCETPKSPPGDYNSVEIGISRTARSGECETPKSPPGDYNRDLDTFLREIFYYCVKHLNPRQGITIAECGRSSGTCRRRLCETPKSPPGDYNCAPRRIYVRRDRVCRCETPKSPPGDYNAGFAVGQIDGNRTLQCETPKSPPGDYNKLDGESMASIGRQMV